MAVTTVIDANEPSEAILDHIDAVMRELQRRSGDVRRLRAQRQRTAKERPPAVSKSVDFEIRPNEDESAACREAAESILAIIEDEAEGEQWKGEVHLLGDAAPNGRSRVLSRVKIDLHGGAPQAKPTRDSELTGLIGAARLTIKELGEQVIAISKVKVGMGKAQAKMLRTLAKSIGRSRKNELKWKYKIAKEEEKTERTREASHERAQRSAHRWSAMEVFLEEWKDVAEIWSRYFASGNRELPTQPTSAEVEACFAAEGLLVDGVAFSEIFDPIRAIVSTMIAESDTKRRCALAKNELKPAINALSAEQKNALKMRMLQVLGMARAEEVGAWLSLPLGWKREAQ